MNQTIYPANYRGKLTMPTSKSYLQRAIAIACLSESPCFIQDYYLNKDVKAALSIAKALGAKISHNSANLIIQKGEITQKTITLNCGESGLSARMFSPIAALLYDEVTITGEGSLLTRPMQMVVDILSNFGLKVTSNNGFLPIHIKGRLKGTYPTIDVSESSQLLTGLLIALTQAKEESFIEVMNINSKPYIQMTVDILAHFGLFAVHKDFKTFYIEGNQKARARPYKIEGDWSGAAFHLVGAAISGKIKLNNLDLDSSQGDKAVLVALKSCGATIMMKKNSIYVEKNKLNAFEFDATDCPDLFPPLAVLAAACNGTSTIIGTERLVHKESNRALSLQTEMAKVGIKIELEDNKMFITGGRVGGGLVSSQNDHRIAMAMAILGLISEEKIEISDAEAVNKSYPTFFEDFKTACS